MAFCMWQTDEDFAYVLAHAGIHSSLFFRQIIQYCITGSAVDEDTSLRFFELAKSL